MLFILLFTAEQVSPSTNIMGWQMAVGKTIIIIIIIIIIIRAILGLIGTHWGHIGTHRDSS